MLLGHGGVALIEKWSLHRKVEIAGIGVVGGAEDGLSREVEIAGIGAVRL